MSDREISYEQALFKAMAICSKAEKCIYDIRQKLNDWGVVSSDANKMIKYLIEERFIDETRYVHYYVRDKFRFNQWGKIKIGFMLKGKHLPADLIQHSLDSIDEDEYVNMLEKILREKARKTKFSDEYDRKAKLIRFAQSRGFEYETIGEAIKRVAQG